MEIKLNDVGKIVELPIKEAWGPGKIMKIENGYAFIRFRDDGDKMMKKYAIGDNPLRWAAEQSDSSFDNLAAPAKKRRAPAPHLTLAQALGSFTAKYPQGFIDPAYLGSGLQGDKNQRDHLTRLFQDSFGDGQLETMINNRSFDMISGRALSFLSAQKLLGRDELNAFKALLADHSATMVYFDALNKLLKDGTLLYDSMQPYFETVLSSPIKGFAKWPNATLLPFLAQPYRFMFLKPSVLKSFASAMDVNFLYEPKLSWRIYHSLLVLSEEVLQKTKPLGSKDYLDVQAFITVVMEVSKTTASA